MIRDSSDNIIVDTCENPTTLFSCHTDTVHPRPNKNFRQELEISGQWIMAKDAQQLGADDGVGIWLMISMIKGGIRARFVFHADEEIGGIGSIQLAARGTWLAGIQRAIAFDRKGTQDVITHQTGLRCCSDEFATALSAALGGEYKPSNMGVFTDTANYTDDVPECTNVACGYYNEHTFGECLDITHAHWLSTALLNVDWDALPVVCDPHNRYNGHDEDRNALLDAVRRHPEATACLLEDYGITALDIAGTAAWMRWEDRR